MTFHQCCLAILADHKTNPYAKSYAKRGLSLEEGAWATQALYILVNLNTWRGETAKEVRASLRKIGGES